MVQRMVSRFYKISILIVVFIIFDLCLIVFGNMIVDGNSFVVDDGEYSYSNLFYSKSTDKNYYTFSRGYYEAENKYTPIDVTFKELKFTAVNEFKAMAMLSFIPKKNILGYLKICEADMSDEEIHEVYERKNFIYQGDIYEAFGKTYMYGVYKDYIYTEDNSLSREDNFYSATINWNSESVAFFEIEGLDLSVIKQGNVQKTLYRRGFVNVYNKPYSFVIITIILVEFVLLFLMRKRHNQLRDSRCYVSK